MGMSIRTPGTGPYCHLQILILAAQLHVKVLITVKETSTVDEDLWYVGVAQSRKDTLVTFVVTTQTPPAAQARDISVTTKTQNATFELVQAKNPIKIVRLTDLRNTTAIETGFKDSNKWHTTQTLSHTDSYACSKGKPALLVVPFPFSLKD